MDNSENDISQQIIGCAIEVHRQLGPGLLESTYEKCLAYELLNHEVECECQKPLPVKYKDVYIDAGYRIDMLVEKKVIVELKAVDDVHPVHEAQVLTYLKLSGLRLGLILNFNRNKLVDGVKRLALNL